MMEDWGTLRQPSAEGGKADRPSRPMARPARSEAEGSEGRVRAQYRVHFADGTKLDVDAETPAQARAAAVARHPGVVTKIKIVKETR